MAVMIPAGCAASVVPGVALLHSRRVPAALTRVSPGRAASRLPALWRDWRPSVVVAVVFYVVFRALTELVALVTAYGTGFPHEVRRNPSALVLIWEHWDTAWYERIAQQGYGPPLAGYHYETFGPVLPALMRAVTGVLHVSSLTAGMLVANGCLLLALVLLHRMVSADHGRAVATTTLAFLLVWPASFFLGIAYTESVVLLLAVGAFYAARSNRWLLAGCCAALAALTKSWMLVLLLALLWERWQRGGQRRALRRDAVSLVGPVLLVMGGWMLYMHHVYGDALAFVHAQESWGRHFAWPWDMVRNELSILVHLDFLDTSRTSAVNIFDLFTVVLIALMALWWWRRRRAYAVWLGLSLAVFVFEPILLSEMRQADFLFPIFIGLALVAQTRPWLERLATVAGLPVAVFLITRFLGDRFAG
jgi:hypothetical protein